MARPHLVKLWKSGGVLTRPTHAILGLMQLNFLSGPGKALWLATRHEESRRKLCLYALAHGVDASRLAFAERLPRVEDHLARYRQADLFLDAYPYNARTTAADALMADLPVLTFEDSAFRSRVATSLLRSAGLPDIVMDSLKAYASSALEMAR